MAIRKSIARKSVKGPAKPKQIPAAVRKALIDVLEAPAPAPAIPHKPRKVTRQDIDAVDNRLHEACMALLAIHYLAFDAQDASNREWYITAIQELARSTFKGVDACLGRLRGAPAIGNFSSEFNE